MRRPSRRTLLKGIGIAGTATLLGSNALAAEGEANDVEWPTAFHDDGRTSYAPTTGLGPHAALDFEIDDGGSSPPLENDPLPLVVNDGTLFVTTQYWTSFETHGEIAAYDATGDGLVWYRGEDIGFVEGPPTVAAGTLYVCTNPDGPKAGDDTVREPNKGGLRAYDAETGDLLWKFKKRTRWEGSPIFHDDTLYAVSKEHLYALTPDGTVKWRTENGGYTLARVGETLYTFDYKTLSAISTDGTKKWTKTLPENTDNESLVATGTHLFVTHYDKGNEFSDTVWALSPDDGSVVWKTQVAPDNGDSRANRISAPATDGKKVYVTSIGNNASALHALSVEDGEEVWQYTSGAELVSRPTVTEDTVYAGGTHITSVKDPIPGAAQYAFDAESGEKRWGFGFREGYGYSPVNTAAQANDRLYIQLSGEGYPPHGSEAGVVRVVKPSETPPAGEHKLADDTPEKPEKPKPEPKITTQPPNAEERDFDSGATVTLHGSESTSENGPISSYEWDIDADGEFEKTGESIDVELDYCGVLDVTLRVTDEAGQTATESIPLSTV
ncbi:PQQ-binding-like beta-propeller repeat protein [Haladaptatus sp. GCM10025707]|uniref:PQQ-binding-like beta-propeller repeat protein n=1 Tax=unclassified Haladaptatus TaxID=2622732 RepID=UPI0023E84B04|nr:MULTISPECIES: PQQ-binding-like beta-propeller repeat protein [unclassified Haladaptatus]